MDTQYSTLETIKDSFPVVGMSCASCATSIENLVKEQKGVINANVNFSGSSLWIEYTPEAINPGAIKKSVQSMGYDIVTEEHKQLGSDSAENIHKAQLFLLKKKTILAI